MQMGKLKTLMLDVIVGGFSVGGLDHSKLLKNDA